MSVKTKKNKSMVDGLTHGLIPFQSNNIHFDITNFCFERVQLSLVGGFNPSETYEFVSWDEYSQYMGK